jgi:hypothetical protein
MDAHSVTQVDLTIDDASDQAIDVLEYDRHLCGVLVSMLGHLTVPGQICGAKNGLDYQGDLMRRKIEVDGY